MNLNEPLEFLTVDIKHKIKTDDTNINFLASSSDSNQEISAINNELLSINQPQITENDVTLNEYSNYYEDQISIQASTQPPNLSFNFSATPTAYLNQTITYSATITSNGGATANSVTYSNPFSGVVIFTTGSVVVNGVSYPSYNPNSTFPIGDINPGQSVTVSYSLVSVVLGSYTLGNKGTIYYSYQPASGSPINQSLTSNRVVTNLLDFSVSKTVDKAYADVGYSLTYTVTVQNLGSVSASNIKLTDAIPSGTSLVTNSFSLNGAVQAGINPSAGVVLPSIAGQSTLTISWMVQIQNTIPSVNPIINTATVDTQVGVIKNTNTVNTQVNNSTIISVKSVDKQYVNTGDTITYSVLLTNTGNASANNIVFTDPAPTGTSFVTGSLSIGGVANLSGNPTTGVSVPSMPANGTTTIVFKIIVGNTIPYQNPIQNSSTTTFNYIVNPANSPVNGSSTSNIVTTQVNHADLLVNNNFIKTVDKQYADLGDVVNYTINVTNSGSVSANNVVITDSIGNGASYCSRTLTIDGVASTDDPSNGINVGVVNSNQTRVINFAANITSLPTQNPINNVASVNYYYTVNPANPNAISKTGNSNIVSTKINNAVIISQIQADKQFADLRDIITYTVQLNNIGNVSANNIIITNFNPIGTIFVLNSVEVNGLSQLNIDLNTGIITSAIAPGATHTITFKMQVGINIPNPISNSVTVNFNYLVDPSGSPVTGISTSNVVFTQVNHAEISTKKILVKSVDKIFADLGDIITYKINLKNIGNTIATNIVVLDSLNQGLTYINNSLTVDGTSSNYIPMNGIGIENIIPNQTRTIMFKALISSIFIPKNNPISNIAVINYSYTVNPAIPNDKSTSANTNTVNTTINHADLISPGNVVKSVDKEFAKIGEELNYTINLNNTGNADAQNVLITDIISSKTEFILGSLMIDGVIKPNTNPISGINIGTISAGNSSIVNFKATIIELPNNQVLSNQANLQYKYIVNPSLPNGVTVNSSTNVAITRVTQPDFIGPNSNNFVKNVDKVYVDIGDIVTYTLYIKNTGNIAAENVVLTDLIQDGTNFIQGSVMINDNKKPPYNPSLEIILDTISVNESMVVIFKVQVVSVPDLGNIQNQGTLDFNYTLDPSNPQGESDSVNSNKTNLNVSHGEIKQEDAIITSDKANTTTSDIITYTITATNSGNTELIDVTINNVIPDGTIFVPGTVKINNTDKPNANLNIGVNMGSIRPSTTTTMSFTVKVTSTDTIVNSANISYNYFADPSKPIINKKVLTNTVKILNLIPNLNLVEISNRVGALINDIIRYTIIIKNTGHVQVNNIILSDLLSENLKYVGNLMINGVLNSGDITLGINIGNLLLDQRAIVSFDAKVLSVPDNKQITTRSTASYNYVVNDGGSVFNQENESNQNSVAIYSPSIIFEESFNKLLVKKGDTFIYTVFTTNNGDIDVSNVVLEDSLPEEFEVVEIKIDGALASGDITAGLYIGTVAVGKTKVVTLVIKVLDLIGGNNVWL